MDLYIVTLERGDRRAKFAVHTHHADDAARMALARRTGWKIVDVTLDNLPKAIHVADEELEPEEKPSEAQERLRDRILSERDKGNIVFWGLPGQLMTASLEDFVKQPAEGMLYDLNRLEEIALTFITDKKWVNDFAVAMTIRKLVEQRDSSPRPQLCEACNDKEGAAMCARKDCPSPFAAKSGS